MLGRQVVQLQGLDTASQELMGLDLLPISSITTGDWIDRERQATSNYPQAGLPVTSREFRQSYTQILDNQSVQSLFDDSKLGVVSSSQLVWGTYLTDIFDSSPWRRAWLNRLRHQRGLSSLPTGIPDYREHRDMLLDSLADDVAVNINLDRLWAAIGL
jgi:adenosylcobyric acid synthase